MQKETEKDILDWYVKNWEKKKTVNTLGKSDNFPIQNIGNRRERRKKAKLEKNAKQS